MRTLQLGLGLGSKSVFKLVSGSVDFLTGGLALSSGFGTLISSRRTCLQLAPTETLTQSSPGVGEGKVFTPMAAVILAHPSCAWILTLFAASRCTPCCVRDSRSVVPTVDGLPVATSSSRRERRSEVQRDAVAAAITIIREQSYWHTCQA